MLDQRIIQRATGVAYAGMLPGAIGGFLFLRPQLFSPESATATVANLRDGADMAALALGAMMSVIVAQAVAALGFFALFRERNPGAAFGVAGFGLVNAAAILVGAAASWTALQVATGPTADADLVQALMVFDGLCWKLGGLFFGLWLIPMGWAVHGDPRFAARRALGSLLIGGGVGYVVGTALALVPAAAALGLPDMLALPATLAEFWMIGALLLTPARTPAPSRS